MAQTGNRGKSGYLMEAREEDIQLRPDERVTDIPGKFAGDESAGLVFTEWPLALGQ